MTLFEILNTQNKLTSYEVFNTTKKQASKFYKIYTQKR